MSKIYIRQKIRRYQNLMRKLEERKQLLDDINKCFKAGVKSPSLIRYLEVQKLEVQLSIEKIEKQIQELKPFIKV